MFHCLIILLVHQQVVVADFPSADPEASTSTSIHNQHPDIVVLKWPPPKTYYPAHDLPISVTQSSLTTTTTAGYEEEEGTEVSSDQLEDRQDYGHAVSIVVPQSPDPVSPDHAPLPPHPYYRDLPSPHYHEDDDKSPESEWQKVKEKIRLKPVNHQMFKNKGKHVPTLPYAPTQPFYELQYGIDQIRRAVHKMHPMAGLANDVFKKFNMAVKVSESLLRC